MLKLLAATLICLGATQVVAQEQGNVSSRETVSMAKLIQDGYEIKSSSWTGSKPP